MKRQLVTLAAIALGATGCAAQAHSTQLQLPGGAHYDETGSSGFTIYADQPVEGEVPDTEACARTADYMRLVAEQKPAEVAALFADDAYVFEPARETVANGREQIDEFFLRTIGPMTPNVVGVAYVGSGMDCVVEIALETRWNDELQWTMVSLDHFTLGEDGTFSRMIAFTRTMPEGMWPASIPPEMIEQLEAANANQRR